LLSVIGYQIIINLLISSWAYCVSDFTPNWPKTYDLMKDLRLKFIPFINIAYRSSYFINLLIRNTHDKTILNNNRITF